MRNPTPFTLTLDPALEMAERDLIDSGQASSAQIIATIMKGTGCSLAQAGGWPGAYYKQFEPVAYCPHCAKPLRTVKAKQCFECGADWHEEPRV
jgi:hypothetical protein